ncbi:TSL-kinase interacting protein 1 [Rhodococcus sp. AW25M09]|uniref:hypothetical protein n=1 Tax=Rhodococcus sp. AW25M09 TaxID=1268303 RepID=UPI0002ACBDE5|nr:hypothetical protein [Rhodococcus sp. AW25M09]CCQ14554.1 TSL-kinase interacting protein 1 [Rhodococcus sp. AW25M09]
MSSKNLFGGPRTLLIVAAVVIVIALVAAGATLIVRAVLGPPEGENPLLTENSSMAVHQTIPSEPSTAVVAASGLVLSIG